MLLNLATLVAMAKLRGIQCVCLLTVGALLSAGCGSSQAPTESAAVVEEFDQVLTGHGDLWRQFEVVQGLLDRS